MERDSGATGIWWVEARHVSNLPMMHRLAFHSKESSNPSVSSVNIEKACF